MKRLALMLGAGIALFGCGGGSGGVIGSCSQTANGATICIDWEKTATGIGASNLQQACEAGRQTWSSSACPSTNRTGRCRVTTGSGATEQVYVNNNYTPVTADQAEAACTAAGAGGATTQFIP